MRSVKLEISVVAMLFYISFKFPITFLTFFMKFLVHGKEVSDFDLCLHKGNR